MSSFFEELTQCLRGAPEEMILYGNDTCLTAYQLSPVMVEQNTKTP
jgi:hypothetical protein